MRRTAGLLSSFFLLSASLAVAHPLEFTETTLLIQADGSFQVDMVADLDALALGVPQNADDAELVAAIEQLSPADRAALLDRLTRYFRRRVRVRFDGQPAPFEVSFPDYGAPRVSEGRHPERNRTDGPSPRRQTPQRGGGRVLRIAGILGRSPNNHR